MKVVREHDKFYLHEDFKSKPKEYFKFLGEKNTTFFKKCPQARILDIGCAGGNFLYYLSRICPKATLFGLEIRPDLLKKAKRSVPDAVFFQGDITKTKTLKAIPKMDLVFMNGVHTIFDDLKWLKNSLSLLAPGGKLCVFSFFNPEDLDVLVKVRHSGARAHDPWESGWNIFSKKTVAGYLESTGAKFCFTDWQMPLDLAKNQKDPLRSWTVKLGDGSRQVVSGIQFIQHFSLLEITPR